MHEDLHLSVCVFEIITKRSRTHKDSIKNEIQAEFQNKKGIKPQ
jgi:hypothetical protein